MVDSREQSSDNDNPDLTAQAIFESAKQSDNPPASRPSSNRESNSESNENKRSREEISQEYVAPESSRTLRPAAADNSYPLLAPRSTYTSQEPFITEAQNAYMGDSGAPRASKSRKKKQSAEYDISEEVYARMNRSERKRYREKKRRSEVNKGFDDLTALLLRVEYVTHSPSP